MQNRAYNLVTGFVLAFLTVGLSIAIISLVSPDSWLFRMMQILGASLPEGIIQFFTLWIFYFGMLEIQAIARNIALENEAYTYRLLPEQEQYVLSPQDVNEIKLETLDLERNRKSFYLTDLVKKACTKYRANKSTTETLEVVTAQVRINLTLAESEQNMIRYVAWAIPSIGFIGTIIGIAGSLGNVGANMSEEDIQGVAQSLYVAFDTTLLSLLLSIILMFYFHVIQERIEKFHVNMESYVIENLINRIYKK